MSELNLLKQILTTTEMFGITLALARRSARISPRCSIAGRRRSAGTYMPQKLRKNTVITDANRDFARVVGTAKPFCGWKSRRRRYPTFLMLALFLRCHVSFGPSSEETAIFSMTFQPLGLGSFSSG